MTKRVLTADLGNSAAKLAAWELSKAGPILQEACAVTWGADLGAALETLAPAQSVLHCQVAGELHAREFVRAAARAGLPVASEPPLGLEIRCRDAHTIGRDRLFAARGAWELVRGPAIIVDAGTALTVDALDCSSEGRPRFLGGAIAPGPKLLAAALESGAAQLFEVEPDARAHALGQDSREALTAGISVGFVGAAKELVRCIAEEAGCEGAPVILTGGAAPLLEGAFNLGEQRNEPQLIALGLLAADEAARKL